MFQLHHLLPQCSVLENVLVPTLVTKNGDGVVERAQHLLDRVGLSDRAHQLPGKLSGGERQRAAVVRALINKPSLLLADEPTGSLNQHGAEQLAQLLLELNREEQMTLVVVTHSEEVARMMGRVFRTAGGHATSGRRNMGSLRLIARSLAHYRRAHVGLIVGTALAAAILTGALAVGDSVSHTLRTFALQRIGNAEYAVVSAEKLFCVTGPGAA